MEKVKKEIFITTKDNPFDPFDSFDDWFRFDCDKKYFTCSYIDRIVMKNNPNLFSKSLTELDYDIAMREIVEFNPELYKIIEHEVEDEVELF